jgi:four helix bundle protein
MRLALHGRMIIDSLENLQVYQRALEAGDAIVAILERPGWVREPKLRTQMSECADRIPAHISEGFGQGTDRHCAHYQRIARGSANEMCTHLRRARNKKIVTEDECGTLTAAYKVIGKMLTRWIQHLERDDRPRRG